MKRLFGVFILIICSVHSCKKEKKEDNCSGLIFNPNLTYGSISDIDSRIYKTITIGTQTWMAENLGTTRYSNGDLIGTTNPAKLNIIYENAPRYQWAYDSNEKNAVPFGRLYTWNAATDSRDVCPTGWHVPTDAEWITLKDFLVNNGYGYYGSGDKIAKSLAATSCWDNYSESSWDGFGTIGYNQANNNSSGFTALPGGYRPGHGLFSFIGWAGFWWTSSEKDTEFALSYRLYNSNTTLQIQFTPKSDGLSIRCIKDK